MSLADELEDDEELDVESWADEVLLPAPSFESVAELSHDDVSIDDEVLPFLSAFLSFLLCSAA